MKRVLALSLMLLLIVGLLAACGGGDTATPAPADSGTGGGTDTPATEAPTPPPEAKPEDMTGNLHVMSFTNEVRIHTLAFQKKYPNVQVEYTTVPTDNGEFTTKLRSMIQSGDEPDVVSLEAAFVVGFLDNLMDLSDLQQLSKDIDSYQFMMDVATDASGKIKGYTYQATCGGVYYRRSLAKEYLGTDDPVEVQKMMSTMEGFEEVAQKIKEGSGGSAYMVPSSREFTNPMFNNRDNPWVVDGKLNIDQKCLDLLDIAKRFRDNGYEAQAGQWSEGWFAAMNDKLTDAAGNSMKVFSYFLPTWGLPYVIMGNAPDTAGDWAVIQGPLPYSWGGTWCAVMNNAKNPEVAKEFVRYAMLNPENLKNWATGVYTNEYLKEIDPTIGDDVNQPSGDFLISRTAVQEITSFFDSAPSTDYLGGQNHYTGFAAIAPNISLKLLQGTDEVCQNAFIDVMESYISGTVTRDEAVELFKDKIRSEAPDIIVE